MAMALRALAGKLRPPSAREAASRAFSQTVRSSSPSVVTISHVIDPGAYCEHCGKTSSRIADSLSQKNGASKYDFSEELKWFNRKHYMIRTLGAVATLGFLGISGKYTLHLLETDAPLPFRKKA